MALATVVADHREALNYDLMTRTGAGLSSVPAFFDWADVRDFISGLGADSRLVSAMHPEIAGWQGDEKEPMLLAHIADTLSALLYAYLCAHTEKGAKKPGKPRPIPRPGVADEEDDGKRHWGGSDSAIPIADFDDWWNSMS